MKIFLTVLLFVSSNLVALSEAQTFSLEQLPPALQQQIQQEIARQIQLQYQQQLQQYQQQIQQAQQQVQQAQPLQQQVQQIQVPANPSVANASVLSSPPPSNSIVPDSSAQVIDLPSALSYASGRTDVANALLELTDAQQNQLRTQADPLALRPDLVQAEQRSALAMANYNANRYAAEAEIASAYTQALEAFTGAQLSQSVLALQQQSLDIAQIRYNRGGATKLDVRDAETAVADARNGLQTAQDGYRLALNNLSSLLGQALDGVQPIQRNASLELPSLENVLSYLGNNPSLVRVNQGVALAQVGVDLLDPSYASRSQMDNARLQLETAQTSSREVRRALEIQARSLLNEAENARDALNVSLSQLNTALERESLEQQRLASGLIADIAFRQTQLASEQNRLAYLQAENRYINALFNLQASAFVPLQIIQAGQASNNQPQGNVNPNPNASNAMAASPYSLPYPDSYPEEER